MTTKYKANLKTERWVFNVLNGTPYCTNKEILLPVSAVQFPRHFEVHKKGTYFCGEDADSYTWSDTAPDFKGVIPANKGQYLTDTLFSYRDAHIFVSMTHIVCVAQQYYDMLIDRVGYALASESTITVCEREQFWGLVMPLRALQLPPTMTTALLTLAHV